MRLKSIDIVPYREAFRTALITAKNTFDFREGLFLLGTGDGFVCEGEISPLPGFSRENLAQAAQAAGQLVKLLAGRELPLERPALACEITESLHQSDPLPSVIFGVETLLYSAAAKLQGRGLSQFLADDALCKIPVNCVLSGDLSALSEQLRTKVAAGYKTYKLKIQSSDVSRELDRVECVRAAIPADAVIRLDFNQGFNITEAVDLLRGIGTNRIDYVEDPLEFPSRDLLGRFREESGCRIALDESLNDRAVLDEVVGSRLADVLVLKPTVLGGIERTLQIAGEARSAGIGIVITSSLECGAGFAAGLHIAAACGPGLLPCGFDTLGLFERDLRGRAFQDCPVDYIFTA